MVDRFSFKYKYLMAIHMTLYIRVHYKEIHKNKQLMHLKYNRKYPLCYKGLATYYRI